MSRDGAGTMSIPNPDFVGGTTISSSEMDANNADLVSEITNSIAADGQTNPTANLPMASFKHTGVAVGSALDDYADVKSVQNGAYIDCGTAGGTINALTLTPSPATTAYVSGQVFRFKAGASPSDDAVTIAVSGLTAKAAELNDAAFSASVVIEANKHYEAKYDGTAFQLTRESASFGDVVGPASSTDSSLARFDGTTGKLLKDGAVIGTDVQAYNADTLFADEADVLTAGFATTPYNAGTQSSGTYTPDEANGNFQYAVNGGAHTLAPPTNNCTLLIQYTNNASASTITTSGFTIVDGDSLSTTNGDDFFLFIAKCNGFSSLTVKALQ